MVDIVAFYVTVCNCFFTGVKRLSKHKCTGLSIIHTYMAASSPAGHVAGAAGETHAVRVACTSA